MKFNNHTDRNEISETLFAIMNIAHSEYHFTRINDVEY